MFQRKKESSSQQNNLFKIYSKYVKKTKKKRNKDYF